MFQLTETSTIRAWGELFLCKKQGEVSTGHLKSLKSCLKHINNFFGDRAINSIRALEIDNFLKSPLLVNKINNQPLSKKTLTSIRNTFIGIYDFANENEIFIHNPARGRKIPKRAPQTKRRPLHDYEIKLVEQSEGCRMYSAALTFLYAGLRRGELIPLQWTDIDFQNQEICINHSVYQSGNKFIVQDCLKSDAGKRVVKIPKILCDILKQEELEYRSVFVCSQTDGSMHSVTSWKQAWNSYLNHLNYMYWCRERGKTFSKFDPNGYPKSIHITPHMFRHTYATMLYLSGIDLLTMKYLLGHADIKTTLQIYTHIQNSFQKIDIDKFEQFLTKRH